MESIAVTIQLIVFKCNALQPHSLPSAHVYKVRPEASTFFIFHRLSSSCSHFPPLLLPPPLLVFLLAQLSLGHAHIFIAFHGGDVGGSQCFVSHVLSRVFWKEWMARHDIIRCFSKQWFLFTTGTHFRDLMGLYKFTERPMKALYTHEYQDSGCQETRRILDLDSRRYDTSLSSSVTSLLSSKHADTYKLTSISVSPCLCLFLAGAVSRWQLY